MRTEHFYFLSSEGSKQIHGMRWIPDGEVRGVVQLVHGMSEYIARYSAFAEYLTEQGFAVTGHDHLGHGDSAAPAPRKASFNGLTQPAASPEYGFFAEKNGNRALVCDMHHVYCLMKKKYDGVPYYILGHSMGSFLTRQYICCYGNGVDGAILCGTGYHAEPEIKLALALCQVGGKLFGWHHHSRLFEWMTSGIYNKQFAPNRTSADWLSRNEANVDAYLADSRCGFSFTFNGYYTLMLTLYKINRMEYLRRMPRDLPVLFVSGAEDPVGASGKGVHRVEEQFREIGMRDVSCILYPGDRHELLNETDKEKAWKDIVEWIRERSFA
ncbi:MAG: alpha/beta hydrolase [Lachnospiraceae bacterium]|nr:alpha/beta hydrolase [Lachnospiraceae bacterium]